MTKPYTIKLFVPDGDPGSFIIINKMNWTGLGLKLSRKAWEPHKKRPEFDKAAVYILAGYSEESDLPRLYIGQGDGVRNRIESHIKNKDFWDKVVVFTTSNDSLNRAHITWLEWALIQQAKRANRCLLENTAHPNEPVMTEAEKVDIQEFLKEMLSSLPLIEFPFFERSEIINVEKNPPTNKADFADTIIVPAQEEGFKDEFLGNNCWYAIRISGGKLEKIRYIAAYQTAPISAITHYAEVSAIEPYGDGGKYKLYFKGKAQAIEPIPFSNARQGSMQSARYTSLKKLLAAKKVTDLF